MSIMSTAVVVPRAFLVPRAAIAAENLCLRQQLAILRQSVRRPRLRQRDRVFWVWLSRLWTGWRSCLVIVQPDTVLKCHRQGFKLSWRWRSRKKRPGRPKITVLTSPDDVFGSHSSGLTTSCHLRQYALRDQFS